MLTAAQAQRQTQQNQVIMRNRELREIENAINRRTQNGDYYCYEQIRFPETIAKLRENGFIVTRDTSELGYKISWGNLETEQ